MRSTFYGLEIAKTGLFISQNQLDVSGHNISNVDTKGYTRQRLSIASLPPAIGTSLIATDIKGTSGRGVTTICVEQIRNPFLDYQFRKENSVTSKWQTKEQYFEYVEALFNNELDAIETSTGISAIFSDFYDALYELQEQPEDKAIRLNVQQKAIVMTDTLNNYFNDLVGQQDTLNESVRITVDEINSIAREIAQLNEQIYGFELSGAKANDLRDQRNALLDTLSGLIDIETFEDTNGQLIVQVDGKNLVRHADYKQMATVDDIENPIEGGQKLYGVYWEDSQGNPTTSTVGITGGSLKGYMDIRDGNSKTSIGIPYVIDQLNGLCQKIAADMNEIHEKGYTIPNGDNGESKTGIDFFHVPVDENGEKDYSKITAQNFRISDDIMNDVYNIAASDMKVSADGSENEQKGNGRIALEMCGLINKKNESGNDDSIDGYYKNILNNISVEMDHIHSTYQGQAVMVNHLEQQRRSISDVSLDEEMTDVIRFGHAYNAASRVISAIDEELDNLINKMGLVGRA
ncbi:flagellar hook-associated protein FlgK [Christensenella tenuis]|uniref:Flagellar hook-associated protein 1 n=1 Tax=Christensenella tenuis TaxID=2763033 RepID=A0ABR7EAS2_9FIRM|nr:flagellar hook-associated protein FlgK [Christensenella tenuis]MBC5646763.1 flagellar hook-associated protein FlgK [Christensenella tenuis]